MKGTAKTVSYLAVAGVFGVLAYFFVREHNLVVHQVPGASRARMVTYLVLMIISGVVGCIAGVYEATRFLRDRAEQWRLQSATPTEPVPELQEAERLRTAGEPLDAIRLMREYLQANPYEIHVMARIAEIYRYDLKNDLAAALEYEEMLKHKLPDDQWAWAALHLAKLYGRLNELEKSVALLDRLDAGYGHTVAGQRAKKALEQLRGSEGEAGSRDAAEEES
jgi:tetratricopeptide (TPR) repeat protein